MQHATNQTRRASKLLSARVRRRPSVMQHSVLGTLHYPLVGGVGEISEHAQRAPPYTHNGVGSPGRSDCDKLPTVRGAMLFEGGLNCKAAQANGSLLTWNAARKTKHPEIYSRCCVTSPRRLCLETNKFPYVDWVQTSVLRMGLFACVTCGTAEQ